MINETKAFGRSGFVFIGLLCCAASQAGAETVLAPVVEVKGSASWVSGASVKSTKLRTGDSLAEGSTIKTGADGSGLFSPVPGVAISVAEDTSVSLLDMTVARNGNIVRSRDVVLKLNSGMQSFSLDKPKEASTTSLAVQTPQGTMRTQGSIGTIAVHGSCVKLVSLSGTMTFLPTGGHAPISIEPGSFLWISPNEDDGVIHVINVIDGTATDFNRDGTQLATREATVPELESTRGLFEAALGHAALAVGYGLLSAEGAAGITATLMKINQRFATVGLAPVDAPAVGTSSPDTNSSADAADAPAGFTGGSMNPANISGRVISSER